MPPKKNTKSGEDITQNDSSLKKEVIVTKRVKNNKDCRLVITGISYKDIVNEHFRKVNSHVNSSVNFDVHDVSEVLKKKIQNKSIEFIDTPHPNIDHSTIQPEYFLDSKKNKIKLWPTMIDKTTDGVLALYTNKPCKNCHHTYETHPIGCPIKYVPHNTNDIMRAKIENFLKSNNIACESTDYFEVEHMFCSFPCVKSYIIYKLSTNPSSYKYTNALTYLTLLYKRLFSLKTAVSIPCAHDIDTLQAYGGHLSIAEYRDTVGILQFDRLTNAKRPLMFASLSYIEETAAHAGKEYL
jgi:hypothetical protein